MASSANSEASSQMVGDGTPCYLVMKHVVNSNAINPVISPGDGEDPFHPSTSRNNQPAPIRPALFNPSQVLGVYSNLLEAQRECQHWAGLRYRYMLQVDRSTSMEPWTDSINPPVRSGYQIISSYIQHQEHFWVEKHVRDFVSRAPQSLQQ